MTFSFFSIFSFFRRTPPQEALELHDALIAQARCPLLFEVGGVPDTLEGRFEMLMLHAVLFFQRTRLEPSLKNISQDVVDRLFLELDRALREMGVGDVSIPKKMKKLATHFHGRINAYQAALDATDSAALSAAIARNVWGDDAAPQQGAWLAHYALAQHAHLARLSAQDILQGRLSFAEFSPQLEAHHAH